jgi:predicted alpha/beta superfamily hydrolase
MSETLRGAFRRVLRLENRRVALRPGRLEPITDFQSSILGNMRQVTVYLPAGYDERQERRYPVLYMQDGQNLFTGERAFIPGASWRLHEAADAAIGERSAEAMIIVGIDNAGVARIDEYTPTRDRKHSGGGRADDYGRMLLEELKPMIDTRYRTVPDREHTGIGGSSLGGLLSLHLGVRRHADFSRVAALSPSVWWDDRVIVREIEEAAAPRPATWLDIGGREGAEALADARLLRDRMIACGWGQALRYHEDRRGDHSERAWARRARLMLEFLFPPA